MVVGSTKYQFVTDHLGSVVQVINTSNGTIVEQIQYDEFGKILSDSSPGYTPFGFGGGLYDKDTGLTRFGARDYDAYAGRWTNRDPILFNGGDSNLYGYVMMDPVNYIDPKGLEEDAPDNKCDSSSSCCPPTSSLGGGPGGPPPSFGGGIPPLF
jgi:RHS repeat-associated protein